MHLGGLARASAGLRGVERIHVCQFLEKYACASLRGFARTTKSQVAGNVNKDVFLCDLSFFYLSTLLCFRLHVFLFIWGLCAMSGRVPITVGTAQPKAWAWAEQYEMEPDKTQS